MVTGERSVMKTSGRARREHTTAREGDRGEVQEDEKLTLDATSTRERLEEGCRDGEAWSESRKMARMPSIWSARGRFLR